MWNNAGCITVIPESRCSTKEYFSMIFCDFAFSGKLDEILVDDRTLSGLSFDAL